MTAPKQSRANVGARGKYSRRSAIGLVAGGAAGGLSVRSGRFARAQGATPAAGLDLSGEEVNVYTARHYDADQELYDGFTRRTGATVAAVEADADQLVERIKAEGRNSPADVLVTVDAGRLWRATADGLFRPVASPVLNERIPGNLRDQGGAWFGFSRRARVFAYARDRVDLADLSTYEALAEPEWAGRILVRSSSNIYNQSLTAALLAELGTEATEAWARGIAANLARSPHGGDVDQITAVAAGEGDLAIVNHYYWLRLQASNDQGERASAEATALFFPNQGEGQTGTHVNISGAGVLANAPHPEAAVAFLEYLSSDEAQESFARGNFEYPVVASAPLDPALEALGSFTTDPVDVAVYGEKNAEALLLMLRAGWE